MQIAFGALDDRLDAVAATSRDTLVARVVICGVFAILIAVNLSLLMSALWLGVYLSTEVWSWFACIRAMRGGELSNVERLNYLGSLLLSGAAWTLLAWFYWQEGTEPSRLIAFSILAGILVHAQCFCFRSPLALIAVAAPSATMLLILPLGMGAYSGGPLLNLGVVLVLLLTYVIMSARANMQTAQALEAAEHTAVAANDAKSTFLAMVTHELRTPMNGVLGMTRALQRTQLDLRQQGYVETILRSGDGMLTILNDLLDVSKIEAGQMKLDLGNFDLRAVAEQSVELWSEGAAAKRLSLSCDIDSALPDYVRGDETRIRQIINNLLSNALKFTDTGSVRLSLSAAPGPEAIAGVEITVTDTGPHDARTGQRRVPPLWPGRCLNGAALWRHRPRPFDLPQSGGDHGWIDHLREPARSWLPLPGLAALANWRSAAIGDVGQGRCSQLAAPAPVGRRR